ncbi:MAG: PorT family protein [Alistipes sp.]|nr:PorT family protein [Alistipes sp.]
MKRLFITLVLLLAAVTASHARRFQVGVRVGVNAIDYSLPIVSFTDGYLVGGNTKVGFETALMARLNITRHLHLQTEFEFSRSGYQLRYVSPAFERIVKLHANRVEIPLMLGVNIGPVRLFAGTFFRIAHSEKSSAPRLAEVRFNNSDVGIMGGIGINIRKFFVEARISGYPKSSVSNTIISDNVGQRVRVGRNIRYSLSTGFFF